MDTLYCVDPRCQASIKIVFHPSLNAESAEQICLTYQKMLFTRHTTGCSFHGKYDSSISDFNNVSALYKTTIGDLLAGACAKSEVCKRVCDMERSLGEGETYKVDVPKEMDCLLPADGAGCDVLSSIVAALKRDDESFAYPTVSPSKEIGDFSTAHSGCRNDDPARSGNTTEVLISNPMAALLASLGWDCDNSDVGTVENNAGNVEAAEKYQRMSCILCGVSANVPLVKQALKENNVSVADAIDGENNSTDEKNTDICSSDTDNLTCKSASAETSNVHFDENTPDPPRPKRRRLAGARSPVLIPMHPLAHHRYFCPLICEAINDDMESCGVTNPAWKVILSHLVDESVDASTNTSDVVKDGAAKLLQRKANLIITNVLADVI